MKECPFCKTDAIVSINRGTLLSIYSDCLCGKFIINKKVLENSSEYNNILRTDEDKILFSGYLRNNQPVKITSKFIRKELPRILDYCQQIPLDKKIYEIKKYIYKETTTVGKVVEIIKTNLYTLFYLKNHDVNILKEETNIRSGNTASVLLTVDGFTGIESTLKNHSQSKKVFIACKFDTYYQGDLVKTIKSACLSCGFEASLVSDKRHNNDISHKIISDIKQSKFVIADFTDENNGVYFEAGYAMGESKEVIRLINNKQFEKLHFDTRQFHHIPWEDGKWKELEEDLINQIKATIK